jgi:hypothetical protein
VKGTELEVDELVEGVGFAFADVADAHGEKT